MRQRVLIAAAFALEPKIIVADEPTTALDVTVQKQFFGSCADAGGARHRGHFRDHDLGVVAQICDRVMLLFAGAVIEFRPDGGHSLAPHHAYTRALIAAGPRYDRPDAGLKPVPEALVAELRLEVAGTGARPSHGAVIARSEATKQSRRTQGSWRLLDRHVAALLAMTMPTNRPPHG